MTKSLRLSAALAATLLIAGSAFSNTYTVTTTSDSGAGSLRQAITDANANAGADNIVFNIPGGGPWSITVSSALPALTGPTVIDGTTQPGFVSGTQATYVKVGTAYTGTIFTATGVTGLTVKGLDLSHASPRNGAGIGWTNCNTTIVLDNFIRNRRTGIAINGGQDHTVQNNDLLASGENTNEPCIYMLNITPGSIPGGVVMSGNKFGGNANMGFRIDNMNNLVIGDASVSGAHIVIEDNSGFTAMGLAGQFMLWFNNCNNITIDNVDLSWSGGGVSNSHGVIFSNAVTNSTFTVKNCSIKNRYSGIQIGNGKDVTIQNNDLRGSGHENSYAVNLNNITEANVNGGILMSGNLWGRNTGVAESNGGLRLSNTNNLIIGDENTGVHIKIEDNSGFNAILGNTAERNAIYLENVSNITVDNVDASWSLGGVASSMGIRVQNTGSNGNITIKNCKVQNRYYGMYCNDGKDYTITGNDFRGSGHENQYALYLLSIAEGMIPGGVSVSGNLWGRNAGVAESNGGLYIADMSNLVIGDATTGVHIKIEDNSGFNTILGNEGSYRGALLLERVSNITVDNVDASWSLGGIANSFGIFVQNETSQYSGQTTSHRNVTIKNCDFRNRGMGIRIRGGKDYTVTGNDLRGCGEHGHHALQLVNIQAGTLAGGILAHTNLFGTGASAINSGIYIERMENLTIGDAATGGNFKIEDNSGLNQIVGNDVNSRGALFLNQVSNVTVNSVDCSYSIGGQAGNSWGIRIANTAANSNISILNCNAGNRGRGIWVDNGRDYTITGNNMVGSGNGSPALELSNIIPGSLTGGILASGNTFGTPNFHRGVVISNMRNLLIGDASVGGANIVLEDNCGLNQCVGTDYNGNGALYLGSVNNVTVDNVDCSKSTSGAGNSYGIVVANGANNQGVTIKNCKADNRYRGIYCGGGKDYTVQNNTITNSGWDGTACALDFRDITAGTLPGGVLVSGNTFGNVPITANVSRAGVRFDNMRDLYIGDATTGGNVKLEDGSGLTEVGFDINSSYVVLNLNNISNSTIDNLNLSYSGTNQNGNAIRLSNGASQGTVTIKDCTINKRRLGIYIGGGRDYTITGNNLTGTGQNSSNDINNGGPAVWLNGLVKGTLDGGIAMNGNTFGGANANCALRIDDMRGFTIGDAVSDDIVLEDGTSGLTNVGNNAGSNDFVLYLRQIADVTVNSVDLTRSGGSQFGGGIRVENGTGNKTISLTGNSVGNRRTGIYISGGSDYTLTGNTLTGSGQNDGEPALYLSTITAGVLPGGLSVSANTFGGTNANSAVRFENLKDIVIGDASVSGRNVTFEDGTSGLTAVGNNATSDQSVLFFSNVSNSSINNVDLTRSGGTQFGRGLYVANGNAAYPFSITNCAVGNRRTGIYLAGGRDYTVQNNSLTGSGNNASEPALYLGFLTVNNNLVINNNTFGGANFHTGIRVESTSDLLLSDGTVSGTHVGVSTANGLGNATGYALYLANVNRMKIQNMDLSFTTATKTGVGIQVTTNGGSTSLVEMRSLTVKNRVDGINIASGSGHSVRCSDLSDNTDGLEVAGGVTSFACEQNSFVGNTNYAINSSATITAENNYFGGGAPPVGTPNGVTAPVDATPFLAAAPANCPTTLAQYMEVKGNLNLVLNGSTTPSTLNYTDFSSGKTGSPIIRKFTISNPGGVALTVGAISFTGGDAGDFSATALSPASPIPAGSSATFTVTFTPGATGLRTTTLSIVNNDPNNNPFTAALQGTGKNVLVVTKTADTNDGVCDADCSLREAMTVANSNADADVIEFNIGGGGAQTITTTTALPTITQPLIIDGSSQPGFTSTPLITVNSNGNFTTFAATNVTGLTIKHLDLSRPNGNYDGNGMVISSCNEVFILNNIIKNRFIGILSSGGRDHTIQNNDLQQTGADANNPAVYLSGLTARDVPGGIKMSGNLFGDAASGNRSRFGVRINSMSNLLIGDASVSGAHITIEDGSGMASTGTGDNYCLLLNNVSNTTVDNLDLTATTYGYQGWGIVVSNSASDANVTIKNCKINTRYAGIYCAGGRDYTIQSNDLQKTGLDINHPSLWFQNITPGILPTGILATGNTFGDAGGGNQSRFGIRISGMSNLVIGDASVSGAHITIADGSGMASTGTGENYCLYLDNVSNTTVDNLDLTATTYGYQGWGLVVQNTASNSNVTIKNCKMNNRYSGIYCIGGKDYTISGNDLKNTGNDNTRAALYLSGIRPGTLPAGVVASGNLFGTGTSRTALRVSDMDGLLIGDAGVVGAHIVVEDTSGANSMSTDGDNAVIYLNAVSNLTVNDVDVSRSASGRNGVGIWVENSGSTVYRNLSILNCKIQQRDMSLYISGGKDATVTNNDMRYSGSYQERPALYLANIQSGVMPGGISMSGNRFGGTNNSATSQSGIQMNTMRDLVMADAAGPGVNIVLEDNSGLNDVYGDEVSQRGAMYLTGVRNVQMTSIDLSKMTAGQGNSFALKVNNGINVSVLNGKGSNRYHGYYFEGGRDITVTGNDLTGSGYVRDYPALRFSNVTPGSVNTANGVAASGNTFGGANVRTGLRVDNMKNLLIGDASVVGAHIVIEDASGLNNITQGEGNSEHPAILLASVSDITVDNVDASRASGQDLGGIWVSNGSANSNITIKNCNFNRHRRAIFCTGGKDYTIQNNSLLNCGSTNDQPAIYLQNIQQGSLTGGILMSGNTFGGTSSFGGIRFENMRDLTIGDAATGGNVKIEDNSGLNNMGGNGGGTSSNYVLHFNNVNNATVDNVDLSRPVGATPAQDFTGIRIDNGAAYGPITIKDCNISRHRSGISAQGGKDYTVTGNDLRGCGGSSDDPALWFNGITQQDGTVPMGILANTNTFGTVNSVVSNCALRLDNLCGIRISDGTVANSHIKIAAASGIKEVTGTGGNSPAVILMANTSGMAVEKMDLEFTGTQTGTAFRFQNSNASQYSFSIKDNILKNRRMGVYIINGADYTITGNNFSMTGAADDEPAIRMEHVAEGTLYGGVSMSGNSFGGTGAAFGLKFVNMSNLKISDGALSGTNVNLGAPSANGLYNVTTGNVLHLSGICNATVGMLDLSRAGLTRQGVGLRMNAGMGNTIEKVLVGNRDKGIEISGGSNSQSFTCNTLFDNNLGIDVVLGTLLSTTLTNNILDCNGTGLRSTSTSTVSAANNFWGTANGSTTSGGSGDTYSGTVTATPFLATAPACAQAPPDLETKANNVEIVDGDITPSFDDYTQYCAITGQVQSRTYTLKNTGNGIMNLTGATPVTLSPASGTPFSITSQPADVELLPGETTTFSIQFAPVALGTSNVTLNIASKDCRENPYNFALKGQGCVDIQGTISGIQAICAGQPANLTVNISAGLAPFVVTLSDGSIFTVNNIGDNTVTVNPTATTIYTIAMITDANGCCSTNSGSATVTVNPLPMPTISISETSGNTSGDGILCAGASATLDAGVYSAYSWLPSGNTQTINTSVAGTYTVTVTDANLCQNTASATIVVHANPTPTITETDNSGTADDNIICTGGSATLDAGAYTAYLWTGGSMAQTLNVTTAGTYTVQVTDANGCTATDDHTVSENALPAATLSGALLVCPGTTSALINLNITAGVAPFTVVLSDNSSHNIAALGASQLTVTVAGPTTNSFTITSITGAGGCAGSGSGTATVDFGSAGEIEISGNGMPIADGDNMPDAGDHTDFGLVAVGGNFTRTFTITNSHPTLPLNISGVTITGSTNFTLMTAPASSVAAGGGTTTFVVKFAPTATGTASATVVVNSSDCDEQPYNFDVQGKGATPAAALNFDGMNDYITTANNTTLDLSTQTVELWAKPSGSGDNDLLVGKRNYNATSGNDTRWSIHFQNGNQGLYFYSPAGFAVWTYAFTPNQWYHIAMVTDATSTKLYIDGTFISSKATTINSPTNLPLLFGASAPNFEVFPGSLDEVRIWNTARTCDQISQLRNCELTGSEPNLVAYYKFNQGFAAEDNTTPPVNILTDATANANNGTLTGFALTGATSNWVTPGGVTTGTSCPAVVVPEIDVQGGSPLVSILDGDNTPTTTDHTDFGLVAVNGSLARTFTIFNTGNAALTITSITSDNVKFVVSGAPTSVAANGGSATFTVTFNPTATGVQNATITINNNDCNEAVYDFAVTGKGATPASALSFDGTNDYVSLPGTFGGPTWTELTIEAWVKVAATSGDLQAIVSATDLAFAHLQLFNAGSNVAFTNTGGVLLPIIPQTPTGQWRHVAMVVKSGDSRLYVDGVQQGPAVTTTFDNILASSSVSIGRGASGGRYLNGQLDEVRIWNTARTCDQITQLRNCELTGSESGLVAYYKFNQGFASEDNTTPPVNTLTDATANANNGTLNGFALSSATSNWVTPGGVVTGTSCPAVTAPEANVQGGLPLTTINDGDNTPSATDHTDFNGTFTRSFTIQNTGTAVLNIGSITRDNTRFAISGAPTTVAANGGTATFTVTYNPTDATVQTATITVNSNDCDEAVYDFVVTATAVAGAALDFDGANDEVTIGSLIPAASSYTKEAWVFADQTTGNNIIGSDQNPFWVSTGGRLAAGNGNSYTAVQDPATFPTGTWVHVAVVYDAPNATMKLFKNGAMVAQSTSVPAYTGGAMAIGSFFPGSGGYKWDGKIDEVRIWSRVLCQAEIQNNMNCELSGGQTGLLAYYKFNQGFAGAPNPSVTTLTDASGNSNTGTLTNFALSGSTSNWTAPGGVTTGSNCAPYLQPEVNVQGGSPLTGIADGDPSPSPTDGTDFGSVTINSTTSQTFTIENTGTLLLNVSGVSFTGTNAADFSVTAAPASTVAATNGTTTFTVQFAPTTTGIKTAVMHINNDDCDEADYDIAIQGTATCVAPSFTACPTNQSVNVVPTTCAAPVSYTATASGSPAPTITYAFSGATVATGSGTGSGFSFNKGVTNVTITATSTCSPPATCSFTVTVVDNEPPTITCAAPVTINTSANLCTGTTALTLPTYGDNCAGTLGNALHYGGSSEVTAPNTGLPTGNAARTVEFWVKIPNNNQHHIVSWGNFTCAIYPVSGVMRPHLWGSFNDVSSTTLSVPLNTWTHVAYVLTGTQLIFYVNGVADAKTYTHNTGTTGSLYVGSYFGGTGQTVDEVRIWNVARTQAQIQSTMGAELVGNEPNLVSYYKFNQGTAGGSNPLVTTLNATTGQNGTLTGFLLNGATSNWVQGLTFPTLTNNALSAYPKGTTTVTWTVTDAAGLTATCNQTVTVVDNQAPTLTAPANQALNVIAGTCTANFTIADPIADNCTGATWTYTLSGATVFGPSAAIADGTGSGAVSFNKGVTTVTLNGVDAATNAAVQKTFTVTVTDNEVPKVTACFGTNIAAFGQATGNSVTLSANSVYQSFTAPITGVITSIQIQLGGGASGLTLRVGDGISCGGNVLGSKAFNGVGGLQTITFDTPIPVTGGVMYNFGIIGNHTAGWATTGTYSGGQMYYNGCPGSPALPNSDLVFTVNMNYVPPISINVAPGTCAQNYAIPAPTLSDNCTGPLTWNATFSGNTNGNPANLTGLADGSPTGMISFSKGTTNVVLNGVDASGNVSTTTCPFTVTVVDNEAPMITCAGPVSINTTAGQCTGTTTLVAPTVSDNCPGGGNALSFDGSNDWVSTPVTLGSNPTATIEAWLYPISTTDNMRIISNTSGGTTGLSIRFQGGKLQFWSVCGTWQDLSNTVIPANQWTHIAVVINGSQVTGFINGVQGFTITCSTLIQNLGMGDNYFGNGTYFHGKMDEVRFWNVVRTQAQIAANMNIQINAQAGLIGLYHLNEGLAGGNNTGITTATDNSGSSNHGTLNNFALSGATSNWVTGIPPISLSNNAPSTYPKGNTIVTWTATDAAGNTETCQQTVTVTDNEVPVLTAPANQSLNVIATTCAADYTIASPISDNCTGATWTYTLSGATTAATSSAIAVGTGSGVVSFNKGVTTVTLNGVDASSNAAVQKTFTVTVTDNEKPEITCAGPVTINTTPGLCTGTTTLTLPTVTDNCSFGGNGLNFDGNDDRVATAAYSGTALTGDLTLECWFKGTSMNGRPLMGRGYLQEFDLALWSNQLTYYHGNGSAYTEANFSYVFADNTWYHIAVVRNATAQTVSLYVNGVFQQTLSYGTPLPVAQTAAFRVGNRLVGNVFLGTIDEVRVWTVARTPAQIAGNWNKELAAQPDLFALYHLNEGVANAGNAGATTAADASGNAKDGTLTNFALSGTSSNWGIGAFGGVTNNAPATYPKGNTTVTWTATDAAGNTETCQQTVTVTDNEKPTLADCPTNIVLKTGDDGGVDCAVEVTYTPPTSSDNCDGTGTATYVSGPMSGALLNVSGSPYTVVYTKTDVAGNTVMTDCSFTVTVEDDTKPTLANCPTNIVLKTGDDGGADCEVQVTYTPPTFSDNCDGTGTATLQSGPASGTFLNVIGSPYTVVYTKTDAAGNAVATDCSFTVTVQDDTKPTIVCPTGSPFTRNADATECNYTVQGTEFDPSAFDDNCISASISNDFNSMATLDGADLPKGANTITWTVTDGANLTTTCEIVVNVLYPEINVQGNSTDITDGDNMPDPGDHTDFGATTGTPITRTFTIKSTGQLPLNLLTGAITISGTDAALFAVSNITLPASLNGPLGSITFDVTYTPVGVGTHTATVHIASNDCDEADYDFAIQGTRNCSPPSFTDCPLSPVVVNTDAGQCAAVVNYTVTADGTPAPDLTYTRSGVTTGSDNGTGSGETFNKGNTTVTVTATNPCGAPTCVFTVTVTDNERPTITCPSSNTFTPLSGECTYTLSGTAYDPTGLSDNCGVAGVSNDFNNMATLAGAVLPTGANLIEWTVTDVNGLANTCQFTLTVNPCVEISGAIFWKGDGVAGVNNANVALSGEASNTDATDTNGDFDLVANTGDDFVITPSKNTGGMLNGVTAADATVIQRHLTGNELITDFYRLIAADCNRSNNISSVDAALIRQALLGNPSSLNILNAAGHWRFVRTDYVPVLAGPYTLDHYTLYNKRVLTGVSGVQPAQDFYGVKAGDVFEETNPGVDVADPSLKPDPNAKPLVWRVRDRMLKTGQTIELDFSVVNFTDIAAYQYGMRFDPAVLQYQQANGTSTLVPLDEASHFGTWQIAKGELRTLWSVSEGKTLPGVQPMYRLRFKVLQGGKKLSEVLGLDPAILAALAYTSQLAQREVQLVFTDYVQPGLNQPDVLAGDYFDLLQNRPNSFSERTTIGFILPKDCDAQLRVFDISGRELWRADKSYPAGYHEETIRLDEIGATGMLFYELTTPQGKQTRKMMAVRL